VVLLRAEKIEQTPSEPAAIRRSRRFLSHTPKSSLSHRPKALIGALVVLTAAGGGSAWALTRGGGAAATAGGARSLLSTVTSQAIEQTVNASGTVEPANIADENFAVPGQITAVKVTVGEAVKKGQVLARVDNSDLARQVDIAQANRDSAAAQVTAAEDADASATQIDSARAQLATANDKLAQAKDDLDNATLKATISGTVASVNLAKGDRVSGSGGGSGGSSRTSGSGSGSGSSSGIEIVGTKTWEVDASVSGTDLATIKKGQQARITPSGATAPIFGLVDSVGVVASTASGGSSTFPVTIKVTGTPDNLHPGETATVLIVTKSIPDVLTVPTAALRQENGQTVVTKVVDGKDTTVPVVVGTAYGANTQVTSGLSEGDQVRITINRAGPATGNNNRGNGGNRQFGGGNFGGGAFTGGGGNVGGGAFTGSGGTFTGRANRGGG
jgi:multidrug efflux pump subunit AcrA (membrane-fusion protein)